MKVAVETNHDYAVVTYNLAVALKAYSIQSLEALLFDRLLVMLGNFHLELAFYGAIGTYINESGAEYLVTESGKLAEGSLNGFIRGKLCVFSEHLIYLQQRFYSLQFIVASCSHVHISFRFSCGRLDRKLS